VRSEPACGCALAVACAGYAVVGALLRSPFPWTCCVRCLWSHRRFPFHVSRSRVSVPSMDGGCLCSICCSLLRHAVAILLLRSLSRARADLSASLTDFAEVEVGAWVWGCMSCMSCGVCCSRVHLRSLVQLVLVVGLVWLNICSCVCAVLCGVWV
jgi:hypothetical protein